MDRVTCTRQIDSMLPELMEAIRKECDRLYRSGGIDTSAYGDEMLLPKIFLTVSLQNQVDQYRPLSDEGKKAVKNLSHF